MGNGRERQRGVGEEREREGKREGMRERERYHSRSLQAFCTWRLSLVRNVIDTRSLALSPLYETLSIGVAKKRERQRERERERGGRRHEGDSMSE
jgi:hypothetical protein